MLKINPSKGAKVTAIPTFCARSTRNMSLELPSEKTVTAISTK